MPVIFAASSSQCGAHVPQCRGSFGLSVHEVVRVCVVPLDSRKGPGLQKIQEQQASESGALNEQQRSHLSIVPA